MKHTYFKKEMLTGCFLLLILVMSGCKKFIEVPSPVTTVNSGNVYTADNTAISVLTAIYIEMSSNYDGQSGITSMSLFPELSADNLVVNLNLNSSPLSFYYQNNLSSTNPFATPDYWRPFYQFIYQTNAAIEGLSSSTSLTPSVKDHLLGEAKFMRAFFYFYLVNLYGDVPLVLSTDYKTNSTLSRAGKSLVYEQIVKDLKDAQELLSADYKDVTLLNTTTERIRPNKAAATALLARVYLFTKDYVNAEIQSSSLIDHNPNYTLIELKDVFLKNSKETIWSLQPVLTNRNTWEAQLFLLPSTGPNDQFPVSLSDQLITSFENNDQRLNTWTGNVLAGGKKYYYASKYKAGAATTIVSEYGVVLRLAEQYLIRADARAELGKLVGSNSASSDLNAIRDRAGLLPTPATTKQDLLDAILHERQTELFTEWGHRWFDLKRTGKIDEVMNLVCPTKGVGVIWQPYKALYPIPQSEINLNPGMTGQQNPGYGN